MAQAPVEIRADELGGPGWRVREQRKPRVTVEPWPPPEPVAKGRSRRRRAVTAALTLALFSASGAAAVSLSPPKPATTAANPAAAATNPAAPDSLAQATASPAPAPPAPVLPVRQDVVQAAHEYIVAVAPLTKALDDFDVALHMAKSQPCKCPEGGFDGGAALYQIPDILNVFAAVQTTLEHMKTTEVPAFAAAIDAVETANQQQVASLSAAYQAIQAGDAGGVATDVAALSSEEATAQSTNTALKAALTLAVGPQL
jgi:hypothetical protein